MRYMGVVMLFKVLAIASWAAVSVISSAQAQSLAGPAETPPASFKGSQYVDSRGCVFLRAGIGGRVNWVPRISRDRKALCGQSPASAAREVATVQAPTPAPTLAPAPAARVAAQTATPKRTSANVGKPIETVASKYYAVKPAAPVAVAAVPKVQQSAASAERHSGCPAASPYGAAVTLADGHRTLLCSSDPSFDVGAAASRVQARRDAPQPQVQPSTKQVALATGSGYTPKTSYLPEENYSGNGYRCPAATPVARRFAVQGGGSVVRCTALNATAYGATSSAVSMTDPEMTVPEGYRKAWNDDRLNPNRGIGTAAGQAQQDQIWTRDVPAEAVITTTKRKVYATSSSNAARANTSDTTKRATGRYFVQVGTFGEVANAAQTVSRLQGLGLPVAKSRITSKGRALQIVLAGPFGDAGAAKAALSAARRSGFGDAFIR